MQTECVLAVLPPRNRRPVYPPYFWRANPASLVLALSLAPYAFSLSAMSFQLSSYVLLRIFPPYQILGNFSIDFLEFFQYITQNSKDFMHWTFFMGFGKVEGPLHRQFKWR
jgi:hypothetical protein